MKHNSKLIQKAVLVATATLVSLACVLPGIGQQPAATPTLQALTPVATSGIFLPSATPLTTSTATAIPQIVTNPKLVDFDLISDKIAWGMSETGLLYTADGGKTWQSISNQHGFVKEVFLNANSAWLLQSTDPTSGQLLHTSDKGATWSTYDFPYPPSTLQFFDAQFGVLMAPLDAGAGSMAIAIAYTVDGGQTWKEVFNNDPNAGAPQPAPEGSIPLGGMKTGMYFREPAIGWVTGSRPEDGYVYLYHTKDGGVSWKKQSVPLPAGMEKAMLTVRAPYFFNQKNGVLPVDFYLPDTDTTTIFYTSNDGGESWSATTPVKRSVAQHFFDATHGWSWDGEKLFRTTDGGQTWEDTAGLPVNDFGPVKIDFISPEQGWVLMQTEGDLPGKLYITMDGGRHWQLAH